MVNPACKQHTRVAGVPLPFKQAAATLLILGWLASTAPSLAQTVDTFNPAANGRIYALAQQADGKLLVGGSFTELGGVARSGIGRLNPDGTTDNAFNPDVGGFVFGVSSLAIQPDGKILVAGTTTNLGAFISRLNPDGTLDAGFYGSSDSYGSAVALALQPDGKIVVGGDYLSLGGQQYEDGWPVTWDIGRLNQDGTLDTTFIPDVPDTVRSLALQPDGKILMGGSFYTLDGQVRLRIGRLNANGTLDSSFNSSADDDVDSLAVQADGKILAGGYFTTLDGQARSRIGRLNADGTVDTSFNPGAGFAVDASALQADGSILVGGEFFTLGYQPRMHIGRLGPDGTLDSGFNPGANDSVLSLALQADGKILVGGNFTTLGGESRTNIGRLNNTAPATQSLAYTNSTVTWLRGGSSPEVWRATFESSTDGAHWSLLGEATRVAGGWQISPVSLPAGAAIRARGYVTGASPSFVESTAGVPVIASQPSSQSLDLGQTASFAVGAAGSPPMTYQWCKDGLALALGNGSTLVLTNVQISDAGAYQVVVTSPYGNVTSALAYLTVNATSLDATFNPGDAFNVCSLVPQPGGKIVAGGIFDASQEQARGNIARLNPDGTLDAEFAPGATGGTFSDELVDATGQVNALVAQPDGELVFAGDFITLGGQACNYEGRLNPYGTLDANLNGWDTIYALACQADGKLLSGVGFFFSGPDLLYSIGRLNSDGTQDQTFSSWAGSTVLSLAVQADGKILAGGEFDSLVGQPRNALGRLNPDGTLDATFNAAVGAGGSVPWATVQSLAIQPDGKIIVGGTFTTLAGQARSSLGRLNVDGTLDTAFDPGFLGTTPLVSSIVLQTDGKILVGGSFSSLGGPTRSNIGRLNPDGSADLTFDPGSDGTVRSLAIQADGKILIGGYFNKLRGGSPLGIGRLSNTEPATQNLAYDSSTITWLRGGTSPEVWSTTFEFSTNGSDWVTLGPGTRISGGWRLGGVSLPSRAWVRSRGYVACGMNNASAYFVEASSGPPWILSQPLSLTNRAGTAAAFTVIADGSLPISYAWWKDGAAMADGPNVTGALSPTLTISTALVADAGGYSAVISNSFGSTTSTVASLTVIDPCDPCINLQPLSQNTEPGQNTSLAVAAVGTSPLSYQWRKDGTALGRGTTAALTLTNLQGSDAGAYSVVVSNQYGSVTSSPAFVTVNLCVLDGTFNLDTNAIDAGLIRLGPKIALQPDGKILVGDNVCRLNADGTLDDGFSPPVDWELNYFHGLALAIQPSGKIVAGGKILAGANIPWSTNAFVRRLNVDGSLDAGFSPGFDLAVQGESDPLLNALAIEPAGQILVGGGFSLAGGRQSYVARLNADGTLDTSANWASGGDGVLSLALQADGKIVAGATSASIERLNADGSADAAFNAGTASDVANNSPVLSLVVQPDGKILLGGRFTTLGGQPCGNIGRLNSDGSLDSTFTAGANNAVHSLALQADGKIVVGGEFTSLGGLLRNYIGRLNSDGSVDLTFNPGADTGNYGGSTYVPALAIQADGEILVLGGNFYNPAGQPSSGLARLKNPVPATQSLSYAGSTPTWMRGGASPEAWAVTFEFSTNGTAWSELGQGTRIPGGWRLSGISLPSGAIRARAFISNSFVESTLAVGGRPVIVVNDGRFGFSSNRFGFNLAGAAGQVVTIEASTDLVTWSPLQTNTLSTGLLYFSDPHSSGGGKRFYRAR